MITSLVMPKLARLSAAGSRALPLHRLVGASSARGAFLGQRRARAGRGDRRHDRGDHERFKSRANGVQPGYRSTADKRVAVTMLLRDDEWRQKSDRWIAQQCAVHHVFVGKMRRETTGDDHQLPEPRLGLDGKVRELPKRRIVSPPAEPVESGPDPYSPRISSCSSAEAIDVAENGSQRVLYSGPKTNACAMELVLVDSGAGINTAENLSTELVLAEVGGTRKHAVFVNEPGGEP